MDLLPMNTSKFTKLESIYEKIRQGEPLSLAEKLQVICRNPIALVISLFAGAVVPGIVLCCKRKAEGFLADGHSYLGLSLPPYFWFFATLVIGLVSLHSVFDTSELIFRRKKPSSIVIRLVVCVFIELVWLGIDPHKVVGTYSGWFEIGLGLFLLLAIVFSNAVFFGSVIAEGEIETNAKIWAGSHGAKFDQYEATIASIKHELADSQATVDLLRAFFTRVQQMADVCPAGDSGSSVLDIKRRKEPSGNCRHEIIIREADAKRTRCEVPPPIILSDPLLGISTIIGRRPSDNDAISNDTIGATYRVPTQTHLATEESGAECVDRV